MFFGKDVKHSPVGTVGHSGHLTDLFKKSFERHLKQIVCQHLNNR